MDSGINMKSGFERMFDNFVHSWRDIFHITREQNSSEVLILVVIFLTVALFLICIINRKMPHISKEVVEQLPVPEPKIPITEAGEAPVIAEEWICICGATNTKKFCAECGEKRPEKKEIKCPACGYKPEVGEKIPKFCPECGAKMEG